MLRGRTIPATETRTPLSEIAFLIEIASNPGMLLSLLLFFFSLPSSLCTPKQKEDKEGNFTRTTTKNKKREGGERARGEERPGPRCAWVILNHAKPRKAAARDWDGRTPRQAGAGGAGPGPAGFPGHNKPSQLFLNAQICQQWERGDRMWLRGGGAGLRTPCLREVSASSPWVKCNFPRWRFK